MGLKNWVEVDLKFDKGAIKDIKGLKCGEEEIDVEVIKFRKYDDGSIKTARIGFIAEVPALGYKIYKILQRPPKSKTGVLEVSDNSVRNKFLKLNSPQILVWLKLWKMAKKYVKEMKLWLKKK